VVEDAAHAFGARLHGVAGRPSRHLVAYSFQAIKLLTTGDGGLLVVPPHLAERARRLRWFGIDRTQRSAHADYRLQANVPELGFKYHMNDVNASLGLGNLTEVPGLLEQSRQCAAWYLEALVPLVEDGHVECVVGSPEQFAHSSCWLFTLRILGGLRDALQGFLAQHQVQASRVHGANHVHSGAASYAEPHWVLEGTLQLEQERLCVPCGWWVTREDVGRVVQLMTSFFQANPPRVEAVTDGPVDEAKT